MDWYVSLSSDFLQFITDNYRTMFLKKFIDHVGVSYSTD